MRTPVDKTIAFSFGSHPERDAKLRWTAKLTFPPGAEAQTSLSIDVQNGRGQPVADGIFDLAGQRLKVVQGRASMTYADFVRGKHETALWLYRPGMPPIPGGLTFA